MSYEQYTGQNCDYGHRTYYDVIELRSGGQLVDKRKRGPSCWEPECPAHIQWSESE